MTAYDFDLIRIVVVEQRRERITRAWRVVEPSGLCWQTKLRRNKPAKKILRTLIKGVEKTEDLSRNDYRVLLKRIRRFKSFINYCTHLMINLRHGTVDLIKKQFL